LNANVDLVIFDCDGVLVDSEVISCRAHAATLARHGYAITADQVLDRRAISYVGDAIAAIDLPKCVASSGTPEKIHHGLTCTGLYDRLAPHIFSATQVERGKPAPDLFLFAAERMQVSPERCLVIEDSVPGVTGARAAGMTVLGFHGGSHCRPGHADMLRAAGAALIFDDMRQLPGLIGRV